MIYKNSYNLSAPLRLKKAGVFLIFIFLVHLTIADCFLYAQSSHQKIRIRYINNLLTISAKNADLKNILLRLAEKTNIYVNFPIYLKKKITIKKSKIPLREALKRLLVGLNHAIIYSGSSKKQALISEVFVFTKPKKSRKVSGIERLMANRIKVIESLKKKLSKINENSRRGKGYIRRIRVLKKNIERLKRRLN
ncbi:MAG: hypothetical protein U9R17_19810 [Thermodesulfobacteriota bacterium]|nr:hypothetical protein [Thermodesulfobacteriota bacterium]